MDAAFFRAFLAEFTRLVEDNREYLTELDSQIGDADHGVNLARGLQAGLAAIEDQDPGSPGPVLAAVGRALVSKTGGASGPLYGMAFRRAGRALGDGADVGPDELGNALAEALAGIRQLGGARDGDKTMVDALAPGVTAYQKAIEGGEPLSAATSTAAGAARAGAEATIPMEARKGRASYLGSRSVGHKDPGAASTALLFDALAHVAAWLTVVDPMVGIVLVSHSRTLAEGVAELVRQMGSPDAPVVAAGGTDDGRLGTSPDLVANAVREADRGAGVVIVADLGSSVLTAKTLIAEAAGDRQIAIADTPFVEGAVSASVAAASGLELDAVLAAAEEARGYRKLGDG